MVGFDRRGVRDVGGLGKIAGKSARLFWRDGTSEWWKYDFVCNSDTLSAVRMVFLYTRPVHQGVI